MIYLIARHPRFSPNSEARDEALFRQLVLNFALQGQSVVTLDEATLEQRPHPFDNATLILSMARSAAVLQALSAAETRGVKVINSPKSLLHAQRTDFQHWFAMAGHAAPHWLPQELLAETLGDATTPSSTLSFPLWWKRNNTATQQPDDVQFVENLPKLQQLLAQHSDENALLMAHIDGQLVKGYGVEGTHFFHAAPHPANGFSKFGHEVHNNSQALSFSSQQWKGLFREMQQAAQEVAQHSGFVCYGCDMIVREDGSFVFIDFNDFPSFSACLPEASAAIVQRAQQAISNVPHSGR